MPYADGTTVTVAKSREEIEATLVKYGADQFVLGWEPGGATVGFRIDGRQVTIRLPLPEGASKQDQMERWRALSLSIKAKCVAVDRKISTLEKEFLADVRMWDGRTVYEWAKPSIDQMYLEGKMPPLLPAGPGDTK